MGQNLGQIRPSVVRKTKKLVFQWVFFIFCMRYTFTSKKVVVIGKPDWTLKTKLARNTIFEGNYDKIFAHFGLKIAKSDYFRGFLASLF